MAKRKTKRPYASESRLEEALLKDREEFPVLLRREVCGFGKNDPRIVHPVSGPTVMIETRTGSGTTFRTVMRSEAFGRAAGVIRQTRFTCGNGVERVMAAFYGKIDRDLKEWQYKRDLALRVPSVVKEEKYRKERRKTLRKYYIARGLI